jgi:hypothetical protein
MMPCTEKYKFDGNILENTRIQNKYRSMLLNKNKKKSSNEQRYIKNVLIT